MPQKLPESTVHPGSPEAWAPQPFLEAIPDQLVGRFIPIHPPLYDGDDVTLYQAIRFAADLDPSLGLIAWKNHHELRVNMGVLYGRLNWALQQTEGPDRADAWSMNDNRTEQEVLDLCEAATDPSCPLPDALLPVPQSRLLPQGVSGVGKYRGAITSQLAVLRAQSADGYGPLIVQLLNETSFGTDRDLIEWLEERPDSGQVDDGPFPVKFSETSGRWLGGKPKGSIAKFCREVASDWSIYSDNELIALLDAFDPSS